MVHRLVLAFLASVALPVAASAAHVHDASCNHQTIDDQGESEFGGLSGPASSMLTLNIASPGMTFVLNNLGGVGPGSDALRGFQAATAMWASVLRDPITIRLDVRFVALAPNVLGSTASTANSVSYAGLAGALDFDAKSVWDRSAVAALQPGATVSFVSNEPPSAGPIDSRTRFLDNDNTTDNTTDNNRIQLNTALVKALGGNPVYNPGTNPGGRDGSVEFSTAFTWDFDPTDGITPGAIDFVGVAAHEIGHALGFVSGVDFADFNALPARRAPNGARGLNINVWGTVNDLQRYGEFGGERILDWSVGGTPCFSINGGRNCITPLSTGFYNGDRRQASHWKDDALLNLSPPIGIMDPTATGPGGLRPLMTISKYDLIAFDVMGYDLAVPEPGTWMMLITGFGLVGATMRRRRDGAVVAGQLARG